MMHTVCSPGSRIYNAMKYAHTYICNLYMRLGASANTTQSDLTLGALTDVPQSQI